MTILEVMSTWNKIEVMSTWNKMVMTNDHVSKSVGQDQHEIVYHYFQRNRPPP